MGNIDEKRKLIEQARLLVNTKNAATTLVACSELIDALGKLMSDLTGEVVRVRMTAEGQPEVFDMVFRPTAAVTPH